MRRIIQKRKRKGRLMIIKGPQKMLVRINVVIVHNRIEPKQKRIRKHFVEDKLFDLED
jgi:hypothetical protein